MTAPRYFTRQMVVANRARAHAQARGAGLGCITAAATLRAAELEQLDQHIRDLELRAAAGDPVAGERLLDALARRANLTAVNSLTNGHKENR